MRTHQFAPPEFFEVILLLELRQRKLPVFPKNKRRTKMNVIAILCI